MNQDCIGEPVSWLRLERFALDELAPAEREAVTQHIERCPACRACLETIRSAPQPVLRPLPRPERSRRSFWLLPSLAAVAAAAAAVMLFVFWPAPITQRESPGRHLAVKGGELALTLVRERQGGGRSRIPASSPPGIVSRCSSPALPRRPPRWSWRCSRGARYSSPCRASRSLAATWSRCRAPFS